MSHDAGNPAPQRVIPYLSYADAPAAIEFLGAAFGFEEQFRVPMPDGRIGHAELAVDGIVALMLASAYPEIGFESPAGQASRHGQVYCHVDDVDQHHDRARAAGATIVGEPKDDDHGSRSYRAVDPEGHRWIFSAPIRSTNGGA